MFDGINVQDRDIMHVPSRRRNPIIADVFSRLNYMERRGSGFKKIIEDYRFQHNYTEELAPVFRSEYGAFFLTLKNLNYNNTTSDTTDDAINGVINDVINLSETEYRFVLAIQENPHITKLELSAVLGVSTSTIDRTIKKLKAQGVLIRVGSNKTGYWQINTPIVEQYPNATSKVL
jgi:predicted HTH transcriptional regulator